MEENDLKKLRGHYHSLLEMQRVFDEGALNMKGCVMHPSTFGTFADEIGEIEGGFPGLLPTLTIQPAQSYPTRVYDLDAVRTYLGRAIGKLKVQIDNPASTPVTETREFPFVKDHKLRKILERDYNEIQRNFVARCWKSAIILSGSCIEAVLLDLLLKNEIRAKGSSKAPKKPDLKSWDLADLIDVVVDLGLVRGVEKLSHSVREYRNLVHPGNEIRKGLRCEQEEAKIAIEVLNILHRDLS
jgi:hypothetical protein